ncbi:MAG TPA: glycosyltransferase [Candidatus Limnocylindrales bacterium]|nr:glycosyltransferase [Candidatus Limnocylindrales bacterium]
MSRQRIPDEVLAAAHARSRARAERDWTEADRLRGEIEAAGWRVVDRGTNFELSPAAPPTLDEGGEVRYGSSAAVPSRLSEPSTGFATVVIVATDWPADLERALDALAATSPNDVTTVVVADGPSPEQDAALTAVAARPGVEVVRTSERLGQGAALNIGLRRASGPVVIVLDTSVEPRGDIVTPLVRALDEPTVGVAGGWGIVSDDLRRFTDAPPGDVTAIEGYALAFRRSDGAARGPLDERFRFYRNLDIWWSLALREEGRADGEEDARPRRAVAVELPAERHEHRGWTSLPDDERDRLSKRNFYRIIDRFGSRRDLAGR